MPEGLLDLTHLSLAELLTEESTVLDEAMRKVLAAAEDETSLVCGFNSVIVGVDHA